ncbi:hypothetical protein ACIQPR_40785 [Streptomyces sp. NPDC091280]|uniref:hypothetical protein n=1 Tax=Streptomyces sp. NPDC091280 TaxID=3365984 RepID=UPI00381E9417
MGVFDWILRKPKATEDASTADTETAGDLASEAAGAAEQVSETEAGAGVQEATAAKEAAGAADGVEIPKQQSAEVAADNEAGEGART